MQAAGQAPAGYNAFWGDRIMKHILVVDNSPVLLRLMKTLLEKDGFRVETAQDGLHALDVLENFSPDVMFVDLVMPNIGGA